MEWEVVIGLETHVQLSTKSKIFSGSSCKPGAEPNTHACPIVCPSRMSTVLNKGAVERPSNLVWPLCQSGKLFGLRTKELFLSGSSESLSDQSV